MNVIKNAAIISVLIVTVQLFSSYLRWIVFSRELVPKDSLRIGLKFLVWSVVAFVIYFEIFLQTGIGALEYKLILILGEIPYIGIFFYSVGGEKYRHFFVYNMVALWMFILYAVSTIIVALLFIDKGWSIEDLLLIHIKIIIAIFVLLLPTEKRIFTKMWLPQRYFKISPQAKYLSFLPVVLLIAHFIRLLNDVFFQSWEEILSRLYLPFVFIFLHRYTLITTRLFHQQKNFKEIKRQMRDKFLELKNYNRALVNNQESIRTMNHDLRHAYRLIYTLLNGGEIDRAREFIIMQKMLLETETLQPFCKSELINSALNFFFINASDIRLKVTHKITIPEKFSTNEDDLAMLIAHLTKLELNLIKNSVKKSKECFLEITYKDRIFVLEIRNNFSPQIELDDEGLPKDTEIDEIKKFCIKYNAATKFLQRDDSTKLLLRWND